MNIYIYILIKKESVIDKEITEESLDDIKINLQELFVKL